MQFAPTYEHRAFAEAIDDVAGRTDPTAAARAWARGDHAPGLVAWGALAELGLVGLRVPEGRGGSGGDPADLVIAFERLGYHGFPGPYIESAALLAGLDSPEDQQAIAEGRLVATAAVDGVAPYAAHADAATAAYLVSDGSARLGRVGSLLDSVDPTRRLAPVEATGAAIPLDPAALDEAMLAAAATLVGAGQRTMELSVAYAKLRTQFGRAIGEYQAVKHQLANVAIAIAFARPLVQRAALTLGTPDRTRDVSAAKLAAGRAAYLASRVALQVHGAVGYTEELDLELWLLRIRSLVGAWGDAEHHRARIAAALETAD